MRCLTRLLLGLSCSSPGLAGCASAESGAGRHVTHTDSMGVTIVTNAIPPGVLPRVLSVSAEPLLRIGAMDGAEELLFNAIRSSARLSDGRIAVANGRPPEIRIFSESGEFLGRHGRSGGGPGEFQFLGQMFAGEGDTLLAINFPAFQLMRFTADGGYADMITASPDSIEQRLDGMSQAEGIRQFLRNGALVVAARARGENVAQRLPTGELFRPTSTLVWISPGYSRSRVVGRFGESQQMFVDLGDGQRSIPVIPPSARRRITARGGRGTRFCLSGNDGPEVHCLDDIGTHLVIRWNQEEVPTSEEHIEAWRQPMRELAARPRPGMSPQHVQKMMDEVIIPPTRAPVDHIIVDAERRVLVSGPDLSSETSEWRRYRVFSATGELLGVADLPRLDVHELGDDYLLGLVRDDLEVEYVVMHGVSRTREP